MHHTSRDPIASPIETSTLQHAVADRQDEAGAGATGPHECIDQMVRLMLAVSAIRGECLVPGTQGTAGTLSLVHVQRRTVMPDRISRVLTQMIETSPGRRSASSGAR